MKTSLANASRVLYALVLFAASSVGVLRGQSAATGTIEGRVLNVTSGAYRENAQVSVLSGPA